MKEVYEERKKSSVDHGEDRSVRDLVVSLIVGPRVHRS